MNKVPCSYKDPSGNVYLAGENVFRCVSKSAKDDWLFFIKSGLSEKLQKLNYLQKTTKADINKIKGFFTKDQLDKFAEIVEHKKLPFLSYPYEWSFEMLKDAAILHLDLLNECLKNDFITKDGTSYNIQFQGSKPIFIDILSIVPYKQGSPWVGFRQFCQLFLFPLMIMSYKAIPFQIILKGYLDGIDVLTTKRLFSLKDILKPGIFTNVFLQALFQTSFSNEEDSLKRKISAVQIKKTQLQKNILNLKKTINQLPYPKISSPWLSYSENNSYNQNYSQFKKDFVEKVIENIKPSLLFDLGCNTGDFSILAAKNSNYVIALDSDYQCIDRLYQRLKKSSIKNILPLVVDITNPSPNLGWKLSEFPSFFNREKPDVILCLALIHHLVLGKNIPLENSVEWLSQLAPNIIFEFITKEDPKAEFLLKEKEDTYPDYNIKKLESCFQKYCSLKEKMVVSENKRIIYWFQRK